MSARRCKSMTSFMNDPYSKLSSFLQSTSAGSAFTSIGSVRFFPDPDPPPGCRMLVYPFKYNFLNSSAKNGKLLLSLENLLEMFFKQKFSDLGKLNLLLIIQF
jgi:hypothetical protein